MTNQLPGMRLLFLPLITTFALAACTMESRHKLWQTLDPAGYKHAHSEVFNPKKYRREADREHLEERNTLGLDSLP